MDENFNSGPYETDNNRPVADYLPNIKLQDHYNLEFSMRYLPRIDYYSFHYDDTLIDPLRGEFEQKSLANKLCLPVNFELIPKDKVQDAHGIEHTRDLEVHVSYAVLKYFNLNPRIGDLIWIHDAIYKVTELDKENFFAGSTQPLGLVMYCVTRNLNEYPLELQEQIYPYGR